MFSSSWSCGNNAQGSSLGFRFDVLQRSESMAPEERRQFVDKVWSPLETIAKHLAVEQSKFTGTEKPNDAATRYQETLLDAKDEEAKHQTIHHLKQSQDDEQEEAITVLSNHKSSNEEDYASTEKYDYEAQKIVGTTTESECDDCVGTTTVSKVTNVNKTKSNDDSRDIDTVEGFKQFSDSVS